MPVGLNLAVVHTIAQTVMQKHQNIIIKRSIASAALEEHGMINMGADANIVVMN